jgi:hypothetical protein
MLGRFIKFLIALALVPLVVAEVRTIIDLAFATAPTGQWRESWFVSLGAGFIIWIFIFVLLPRTMWLYVLGHEFTHALATMLAGGKVSAFKVTSKGGHVITDRVNWWIALSPYFVPIYALIWIGLWVSVDFYYPLKEWQSALFFGIGLLWSFHLTFTVSMMHPSQTDLSSQGYIFSGVIIVFINLALFLLLLGALTHDLRKSGETFLHRAQESYLYTGRTAQRGFDWAENALSERTSRP